MMQTEPLSMTQSANHRIRSFRQRFGDGHLYLACHAALPLALTPDLLYRLWATFQRDCQDDDLAMPWVSVSDLLLSGLCDEVGDELYEMDSTVRDALMQQLKDSPRLGLVRVRELAEFVIAYIDPQRSSADLDTRDFAQAQHWRALAYNQPREAVQSIATTLAELSFEDTHEWIRMAALVETLEEPLVEFPELLVYVGAIDDFARGNDRSAMDKLMQIADENQQIQIADVDLPIPVAIPKDLFPTEPVTLKRKIHLIDRLKQNAYWLIGGGIAVTTVAIVTTLYISSGTETASNPPSTISSTTPSPQPNRSISPSPTVSAASPTPSGLPTPSPTSTIQPVFSQPVQSPPSSVSTKMPVQDPAATVSSTSTQTVPNQPKSQPISPIANLPPSSSPNVVPAQPSPSPPNVNPIVPPVQRVPNQKQTSDNLMTAQSQEILDAHNQCRSSVNANIPLLQWSNKLASTAQDWADKMPKDSGLQHNPGVSGGGFGENIAAGGMSPSKLVKMWCDEKENYDEKAGQCQRGTCGHFTQVVWRRTNNVGCGMSSHPTYGRVLVCNYDPPGNYVGERAY